ncbi:MAG TPA: GNAT family N-acetyltransferase [Candidatus Angelobacter sp.]|nr:GNAT family N-acetyltransferase [Candidatus Angelobacter sp.]
MTPELETPRLLLLPLALADAVQTQPLFARWEIVRYLSNTVPWPYPPDGALRFYEDVALPSAERGEAWHWTLRLKSSPRQIIGSISLRKDEHKNRGFWIGLPWQGQGFANEAAEAVTSYWFGSLGFSVLRVPKAATNIASRRISEKQGMRLIATEERDFVCGRLPAEIWEITAQEWKTWKNGRHG